LIQWDSHAIADGGWYMRAEAVDGAGNPADSDPIFFTVANDGPTISFGCFVGDGAPGSCTHWFTVSPVSLNIDTTDPQGVSSVKYTLDGSDPATNGTPFKTTLSLAQTTLVRVVATDTLGNVSTASLELQIDTTAPAAPSFTYENVSGNVVGNGSTVWFQPGGSGSVQVDVLGNDA
jgi:hypothetical protein